MDERQTLGIIGLGAFGSFMAKHLAPYYRILGYDKRENRVSHAARPGREADGGEGQGGDFVPATLAEAAAADIVAFAVPLAALEQVAAAAAPHIRPGSLVVDVTSVKLRPLDILTRVIPEHAQLLGTHPLFGPQSGKNGIAGLRIALCPVRIPSERYYRVCDFLTDKLRLLVLKTTPDAHDREMAKVQAMTHFISRGLRKIGLAPSLMATRAYEKLQEFSGIVMSDSWDLFLTIENGNPYAAPLRRTLLDELGALESGLESVEQLDLGAAAIQVGEVVGEGLGHRPGVGYAQAVAGQAQ